MEPKFKIGDIVKTIPGFNNTSELLSPNYDLNYGGSAYKENLTLVINHYYITASKRTVYYFESLLEGIYEEALISVIEERDNKLKDILA